MSDDFPIGTIAGPGRPVQAFRGRITDIPDGWALPVGQTLRPDQHEHPKRRGKPWKLPDMSREFITGTSTHIDSWMDDEGKIGKVAAANGNVPGIYTLIKVKSN